MVRAFITLFFIVSLIPIYSQSTSVRVQDAQTGEGLISANVIVNSIVYNTDHDGISHVDVEAGDVISVSYVGYTPVTLEISKALLSSSQIDFSMSPSATLLETAVVTGSKYERSLAESPVSLEVIKAEVVSSSNAVNLENVLQKVPGVQMLDGQVNIRGGSGYSYGAGSRVLILVDDMPAMQADAGRPNWSDVPIENIAQVEILKGAASALYGSAALNGIINLRTGYATSEPVTKFSIMGRSFMDPSDPEKKSWSHSPYDASLSILHKQKFDKLDLVVNGYLYKLDSYNSDTYETRGRIGLKTRYRHTDRLSYGVNANFNTADASDFFFWKDAARDNYLAASGSVSSRTNVRYFIDPHLTYFDKFNNKHKVLSRYHFVDNNNNMDQANSSHEVYAEYQFQRTFPDQNINTSLGAVTQFIASDSELFSDTLIKSYTYALYGQVEKKFFDNLTLSAGLRYEYNDQKVPENFLGQIVEGGKIVDSEVITRFGANWKVTNGTFVRASYGEGFRYPTITERLITTSFSGLSIFPNLNLVSERGWSAEIGIKQGFGIGGFNGYVDFSRFITRYQNMMEFTFTQIEGVAGLQSQNVGDTEIDGYEITVAGKSNLLGIPLTVLGGYSYIDPRYTNYTPELQNASTSDSINVLKYRTKHSFKLDIEAEVYDFTIGVSSRHASHMLAIDRLLGMQGQIEAYRQVNNDGFWLWDTRVSYKYDDLKLTFLVGNALNEEYTVRPGLLEAPRNVAIRIDYDI